MVLDVLKKIKKNKPLPGTFNSIQDRVWPDSIGLYLSPRYLGGLHIQFKIEYSHTQSGYCYPVFEIPGRAAHLTQERTKSGYSLALSTMRQLDGTQRYIPFFIFYFIFFIHYLGGTIYCLTSTNLGLVVPRL